MSADSNPSKEMFQTELSSIMSMVPDNHADAIKLLYEEEQRKEKRHREEEEGKVAFNLGRLLQRRPSQVELWKQRILNRTESVSVELGVPGAVPESPQHQQKDTVMVWGDNKNGELSIGTEGVIEFSPVAMKFQHKAPIAQIAPGLSHTLLLTQDGGVFAVGSWVHGVLGTSDNRNMNRFKEVKSLMESVHEKKEHVISVANGGFHSIALTDLGHIYTWGGSLHGKLGREFQRGEKLYYEATLSGKRVVRKHNNAVSVSCGQCHTIVATDEGEVYTFGGGGKSLNYGQLGFGKDEDSVKPRRVTWFLTHSDSETLLEAREKEHKAMEDRAKAATLRGENSRGGASQSRHGLYRRMSVAGIHTNENKGIRVIEVCAGAFHSMAISENRSVYSWGRGDQGQLGQGEKTVSHNPLPKKIQMFDKVGRVTNIGCGENHSLVCTEDGSLFTFGYGQHGQLGHDTSGNEMTPKKVAYFAVNNVSVVECAGGTRHSICLSADMRVYTFGHNEKGQLGLGLDLHAAASPKLVKALTGLKIKKVAAGGLHCFAYSSYFTSSNEMRILRQVGPKKPRHVKGDSSSGSPGRSSPPVLSVAHDQGIVEGKEKQLVVIHQEEHASSSQQLEEAKAVVNAQRERVEVIRQQFYRENKEKKALSQANPANTQSFALSSILAQGKKFDIVADVSRQFPNSTLVHNFYTFKCSNVLDAKTLEKFKKDALAKIETHDRFKGGILSHHLTIADEAFGVADPASHTLRRITLLVISDPTFVTLPSSSVISSGDPLSSLSRFILRVFVTPVKDEEQTRLALLSPNKRTQEKDGLGPQAETRVYIKEVHPK